MHGMRTNIRSAAHTASDSAARADRVAVVLAFGLRWCFAGLVTNVGITCLGGVLVVYGCVGWFRQVLPHEAHEDVPGRRQDGRHR